MSNIILGVSAYYHDSAASIVKDGHIVAAAQEERYSRIKHDPAFPKHAIEYCLEQAGCTLEQCDAIIFYDKPLLKFERLLETYFANAPRGFKSFLAAMPIWLKEKLYLKSVLRQEFRQLATLDKKAKLPQLLFSEHHLSHASSAFYPSPYEDAAVLCLDGVGEWATSSAWHGNGAELNKIWEIQFPHSLGLLYSAFTYYCGFKVNSGEYKLMGLAPYGEPKYVDIIFKKLIKVHDDGSFDLDMDYFDFAVGQTMTNRKFDALFNGAPRHAAEDVTQKQMDLARSIQVVTEEIVLKIVRHLHTLVPSKNLCLAGGVALNCVSNGRLLREGPYENIWVQPAAGDAGGSLGAALVTWYRYYSQPRTVSSPQDSMRGSYLGDDYNNEQIWQAIETLGLTATEIDDSELFNNTAELIDKGNVVGWFQGKMEFGPRALGNRSIIGDPRNTEMQSTMNLKIKERESFRPFAPAVLAEDVQNYFEHSTASPYMLMVSELKPELTKATNTQLTGINKLYEVRSTLPAITHVDYSARIQTVHKDTNDTFYSLLKAFKAKTGCSVLINTSFNVRGEPPVRSPLDALRCFLATEMDYLVMNNIMLTKASQPMFAIKKAKSVTFDKD